MMHMKDRLVFKAQLSDFSALVLHHTVILLLLTHSSADQSQLTGTSQSVVAVVGDDVILPCHLKPAGDATGLTVEWTRPDLDPKLVHLRRDSVKHASGENSLYKGRTSLSINKLKCGDISLTLSKVKLSDAGTYKCLVPPDHPESAVELTVGSVSSPEIDISKVSSGVLLECESKGWYPEPEMVWLDGEGNLLSAGPTETVRGPDDLYTVSSRVTVEKRHSNNFTCRVQQKKTNQTREIEIQVSADYFVDTSSSAACVGTIVVAVLVFVLAAAFVLWKWRENQTKDTKLHHETETGNRERERLMAEEQKKVEEQKVLVKTLTEQRKEMQNQEDQLKQQSEDMEKNIKDIENKLQSVEKMAESEKNCELKEIILMAKTKLRERKEGDKQLTLITRTIKNKTDGLLNTMTGQEGGSIEP